jgi:hypothetical protein
MKFLLVKSLMGFGDRFECLAMCIDFAQKNNMKLRVDWSDSVWDDSFYKYFSIDVPSFEMKEVSGLTVYPKCWKGRLNEKLTEELIISNPEMELDVLTKYDADVVVAVCAGLRTLYKNHNFMGLKVIHPRIIAEVRERQQKYKLKERWCIHLRGTDRFATPEIKRRRFQELILKLVSNGLLNRSGGCIILSDDIELVNMWNARDNSPVLSKLKDTQGQALHLYPPESLGTTKEELNIELLIDFFTMASCKHIFSTSIDSRFFTMAKNLRPLISLIL